MSKEFLADWGVPIVGLIAGGFAFGLAWFTSWRFDRQYGRDPK